MTPEADESGTHGLFPSIRVDFILRGIFRPDLTTHVLIMSSECRHFRPVLTTRSGLAMNNLLNVSALQTPPAKNVVKSRHLSSFFELSH